MPIYNSMKASSEQESKPFKDVTKNGKTRPWTEKKISNVTYSELLHILKFNKAQNVKQCGEVLEFKPSETGHLKLYKAWFCKSKLCPLCNWRRSMKQSYQAQKIVQEVLKEYPKSRWLFLTLTAKNVWTGNELNESLSELTKSFNKLMKYKKVRKNLIGFMRTTEVTINKENGSYNQHMHVLLCVTNGYFIAKENYINHDEWVYFWQRALKADYKPLINIKSVKPNQKNDDAVTSAIKETAKYSVKSSDYLSDDLESNLKAVGELETGLYAKRLISYGGELKNAHKRLKMDDEENGNLIHTNEEKISEFEAETNSIIAIFNYQKQNYYLKK